MSYRHLRQYCCVFLTLTLYLLGLATTYGLDIDRIVQAVQHLGGRKAEVVEWQAMLSDARTQTDPLARLRLVNEYFNRRIQFADDMTVWGQADYWATPAETMAMGRGDCEDFAIAKYFSLLNVDIPVGQLRLVYVKARIGGSGSSVLQAHMVLAYYPAPDAEPLVLDNLITDIRPASRRPDLTPVFSFNSQGIWVGAGAGDQPTAGAVGRLSRWQDLLQRAHREGFD